MFKIRLQKDYITRFGSVTMIKKRFSFFIFFSCDRLKSLKLEMWFIFEDILRRYSY